MNFFKEVKPVILQYMNRVFSAYDGHGATIVFDNGLSVFWNFDDSGNITVAKLETNHYHVEAKTEKGYQEILDFVLTFAAIEVNHQESRKEIDLKYKNSVREILSRFEE